MDITQYFNTPENARWKRQYIDSGFGWLEPMLLNQDLDATRSRVEELMEKNGRINDVLLMPCAWNLMRSAQDMYEQVTRTKMALYGDAVVFARQEGTNFTGFKGAHRDMPDAGPDTFSLTRLPGSCVMWIALTDATVYNSCLYVLPAQFDPGYRGPGLRLEEALGNILNVDKIHALPAKAGEVVVLGHRVIHWGSAPFVGSSPRLTLSFTLVDPELVKPKICRRPVSHQEKLAMLAAMDLWYFDHRPVANVSVLKMDYMRTRELFSPWFLAELDAHVQNLQFAIKDGTESQRKGSSKYTPPSEYHGLEDLGGMFGTQKE